MDLSLESKPSCYTFSNASNMSKKTDITSRVGLQFQSKVPTMSSFIVTLQVVGLQSY